MAKPAIDKIQAHVLSKMQALNPSLTYHSIDHTLDVAKQAERIARSESLNDKEIYLLSVAALYHDTGFLETYANHEEKSCEIFLRDCAVFNFSESDKHEILSLIRATKIPQHPTTLMQRIICDADLDYIGRADFPAIAQRLATEFMAFGIVENQEAFAVLQKKFLLGHHYHTATSRMINEPRKQQNIASL